MTTVREERRLVTCMFVDLVGSTDLTLKLGAERLKRELGVAFAEISRIIAAHGGTVEKYVGDAIYAIFGAPIAHEDDTLRALRAAEAIRMWCAVAGAQHGHPFAIRIGIETGEAVVDLEAAESTRQQMSVGAVVNLAARLQQKAEPGEVLVGPTARLAAGDAAALEPLPEAELKGLGRIAMWRLVRVGAPQRRALPFVGRDAEMGLLGHAYERALKGRSVLTIVSGAPGQGKTRLVQEFVQQRAGEAEVILARCRPPDETGVFAPVRDLLGVTTIDALTDQVGRICSDDAECERVVAGLAESAGIAASASLARLPAAEREDEIVNAWRRYVGMLGADRLVLVAIDDVHWADPWIVRLLDRLTFGGPRVLVVATARPEFADAAGIRPSGDRFFIELEGLEPGEAHRLAALAGRDDERVVERAEGNPLFLVELARAGVDGDLPLTLQGALGARLDQLPPSDRVLLSIAAVAGERFTAADAAFLAGRDLAETARALAHLVDLHFLDLTDAGHRFHHGLVREVAYGRLLAAERMKAHARFARERVHPEDADKLTYHWWEALRPPDGEWVWADDAGLPEMRREAYRAHLAAGRVHAQHFALAQAVELLGRALRFASGDREAADVHRTLALAYQGVLRQDETWSHLVQALDLYRRSGSVPLDVYVALTEAAQWYGAFKHRPADEEIAAVAEEGAAAARAAGDRRALARILLSHARFAFATTEGDVESVAPRVTAAVEAAEASGDPAIRRRALDLRIGQLSAAGKFDEAAPLIAELTSALRDADGLDRLWGAMRRATFHVAMAERADDEQAVADALALAEPMGPHNRTHAWQQASEMYSARGEWDKVVDLAQRTATLVREEKESAFCGLAATILRDGAIAHALAGRREDAMALLALIPATVGADPDIVGMIPRALLGFPSPEADRKLAAKTPGRRTGARGKAAWWDWGDAAVRAVILRRPDDAERAVEQMGRAAETATAFRALVEGVREAVGELRGGPPARFEALRKIGYNGWIDLLKRRVDAEY